MKIQKLLQQYWTKRLKALKELFSVQMCALKEAVKIARKSMNKRLKSMNEFRDALKDQAGKFALQKDVDDLKEWIRDELQPLKDQKLLLDTKADQKAVNRSLIIAVSGILLAIISLLINLMK